MEFRVAEMEKRDLYNLLIGLVAPRPVALVTTLNEDGAVNAAPYSSYNYIAIEPPMVALGIAPRSNPSQGAEGSRALKDTGRNIRRVGEFVVNVVTEDLLPGMNVTAIEFPAGVSEIEEAGLHTADSSVVRVPRILEAHAALECVEFQTIEVGESRIVMGKVVSFYVEDRFIDPKGPYVKAEELHSVARMNGQGAYVRSRDAFLHQERIPYAEWEKRKGKR